MTAPLPLPEPPLQAAEPKPAPLLRDSRILYCISALLMFCPLAFGAVEPWAVFILQASSAILLAGWILNRLRSQQLSIRWNPLFAPMIAFMALICIQLVPGVSAYWHATYSQLLRFVAYGIVCFLIVQTLTRHRQIRKIGRSLTIFGVSLAIFAVLQNLSSPNKLYWLRTPRFGGWIYGPYVNHNHYAGLMEMLAPMPLVYAFSRFAHRRDRWIAVSAAAFMAATIFLSGSRGGMIAFSVQIAIFVIFVLRDKQRSNVAVLLTAFLLVLIGVTVWTGARELKARLATLSSDKHSDLSSDVRWKIDSDVLRMWWQRPALGWGQGTFAEVYPRFRSFYTDLLVNAAHDDFLQVLAETGIAGFAVTIWFLVTALRPALRKSRKWQSDLNGALSLSAILAISGILVHSFLDFNMQIPANAVLFYAFCTVAAMEPRFATYSRHRNIPAEFLAAHPVPTDSELTPI